MPEIILQLHPFNTAVQVARCSARLNENASIDVVALREHEGRFSITIQSTDHGSLLEFLNSLPEVSQAVPDPTVPQIPLSLIFVDLSPF